MAQIKILIPKKCLLGGGSAYLGIVNASLREGIKKNKLTFFRKKVLNYGWVRVKSPKLVKM